MIENNRNQDADNPDVIITDAESYSAVKAGKKTILSWPDFAAEFFQKLQEEHPELRRYTLEEFVQACPYRFEIVADADKEASDGNEN